jgi:hypothetical protein
LPGFLNNANVPILAPGGAFYGDWLNPARTPQQILDDLHFISALVWENTKNTRSANTLLLPTTRFTKLATRRMSDQDSTPILQAFVKNDPYIKNVDQWSRLNTADSLGTGPRACAYSRDGTVVDLVIPLEFTQLPPQAQNLAFKVPCHSRIGGVCIKYPLGLLYVDGI